MEMVGGSVLDNGLNTIHNNADKIYVCTQDPMSFADATTTYALGNNDFGVGLAFGAPTAGTPNGRQVASKQITAGNVTASGVAAKWAVVDSVNSVLLANGTLAAPLSVIAGNTFTLAPFTITLPNQ
jgi:hypothetical protein